MNTSSHIEKTVELLFRHEWGKLVAVLTKVFGPGNLQLAEDVVQDTLLNALNNWKIKGLPENPTAWLFAAARNKAIDVLRKQQLQHRYQKAVTPLLQSEYTLTPTINNLVNDQRIDDDQLKMMFVCCHPALSAEAQVAIILKTLCGFSVTEIAKAFVSNYDTIEKRLFRARLSLRENNVQFELPPAIELDARLENVLTAIYLLFNEGYNSTHHTELIRNDLVQEAMRLCEIICRSNLVNNSNAYALLSLMCFTASRTEARLDTEGNILLLKEQDRTKWDNRLIKKGIDLLDHSSSATALSKYHIESGIALEHAKAKNYDETNWNNILHYYDLLYQLHPSPIVALNRAIIVAEMYGPALAIKAIESTPGIAVLKKYYLLPAVLGELYSQLQKNDTACEYFMQAMQLTQSPAEKKLLQQKIDKITASAGFQ